MYLQTEQQLRDALHAADKLVDAQRIEIERMRAALREAAEDMESWGSYASDYFQLKHDLAGDVARARKAAGE